MNGRTWALVSVLGIVGLGGLVTACARWDFGDFVTAETPRGIHQTTGIPAKLSLNEAAVEYEDWFTQVQRDGARWKADIDRADEVASMLGALTMNALAYGEGALGTSAPWALPFIPIVAGLVGFAVKRPGDVSKTEAQAKADAAWDEAFKAGMESIKTGASIAKTPA